MNNSNLLNLLYKKIRNEKFASEILEYEYFKMLPEGLILSILSLRTDDFVNYIILIYQLMKKNLLASNEKKLISISHLVLGKQHTFNARKLIELLRYTNLLKNGQIIDFSGILLQVKDPQKIKMIRDLLFWMQNRENINLAAVDIVKYLQIIRRAKTKMQLSCLSKLLFKQEIREDSNFIYYTEIILRNPENENLDFVTKTILNRNFRNCERGLELLDTYLIESANTMSLETATLVYEILTNKAMLKSKHLIRTLKMIMDPRMLPYYPFFEKLIQSKKILKDPVFQAFLDGIEKAESPLQVKFILETLRFPVFVDDEEQVYCIINYYHKTKEKFKLNAINKLLEKIILSKDIDLYSIENSYALDGILNTKYEFQAIFIVQFFDFINRTKYPSLLIKTIVSIEDPKIFRYLGAILKIENFIETEEFFSILEIICSSREVYQVDAITKLLMQPKVFNGEYLTICKLITFCNKEQTNAILRIVTGLNHLDDKNIVRLLKYILNARTSYKITLLMQIILHYEELGYEKTVELINKTSDLERKNLKEIREKIKEEVLKEVPNTDVFSSEPTGLKAFIKKILPRRK